MAKPSSRWRTTRPCTLPSVTNAPIGGPGARLRHVDDPAGEVEAVRQDQAADRIARNDAAVPAVFGQAEDMAIGEPGELRGELVALARCRRDRHGETVLKDARDVAFEPPKVIDVSDHALARLAGDWRNQRDAARRHVDDLTGKLAPVGKHVAAGEVHAYALKAAALLAHRPQLRSSFG
jgi:hypothetical protein